MKLKIKLFLTLNNKLKKRELKVKLIKNKIKVNLKTNIIIQS